MTSINSKIYIRPGQQVRRRVINTETPLEEFKQQVIQSYETSPLFVPREYDIQLQYYDEEGDWICVDTESEWKEGLKVAALNNDLFRVKFTLLAKKQSPSTPTATAASRDDTPWRGHLFGRHHGSRRGCAAYNRSCWNKPRSEEGRNEEQNVAAAEEQISNLLNTVLGSVFGIVPSQKSSKSEVNEGGSTCGETPSKKQETAHEQNDASSTQRSDSVDELPTTIESPDQNSIQSEEIELDEEEEQLETQSVPEEEELVVNDQEQVAKDQPSQQQVDPVIEQQEEPKEQFHNELNLLETMGFSNRTLNRHLCNHFKGDITKIVSSLLEISHN